MKPPSAGSKAPTIIDLLRPHSKAILLGIVVAVGEGVANLLEPVPLKIVLDNVLRSKPLTGLLDALINSLTLVGMLAVMFYINWRFTLIALSVAPVLFAVVFTYTRRIKQAAREVRKKEGELVSIIQEVLSSIRVVKAFAREDYEQRRLEEQSLESVEAALRARSLKARLAPLVDMIVAGGTALVLWWGARMVMDGTLQTGDLVLFIMYLKKMYKPMQELSKMTDAYSKAEVGYDRIREVLETDNEVKDLPGARPAPRFKGQIEFEKVCFGYNPETLVLKDVKIGRASCRERK